MKFRPNQENLTQETSQKLVYEFCDGEGKTIHTSRIVYKNEKSIIVNPFSLNRTNGQITPKKIKSIEFKGWNSIDEIPVDFKKSVGYGFKTLRLRQFMSFLPRCWYFPKSPTTVLKD